MASSFCVGPFFCFAISQTNHSPSSDFISFVRDFHPWLIYWRTLCFAVSSSADDEISSRNGSTFSEKADFAVPLGRLRFQLPNPLINLSDHSCKYYHSDSACFLIAIDRLSILTQSDFFTLKLCSWWGRFKNHCFKCTFWIVESHA